MITSIEGFDSTPRTMGASMENLSEMRDYLECRKESKFLP